MDRQEQDLDRDGREIGEVVRQLYEVISFEEGAEPDWEGMENLFSERARITRITPEGIDYLDLPAFKGESMDLIDHGVFTSLYEHEVARRVDVVGGVAHVLSAYETKRAADATDCLARGVNSIQMVREHHGWRVLSLCWDDEALRSRDVRAAVEKGGGRA